MINQPLKTVFILPVLTAGGAERVIITLLNNINTERYNPHLIIIKDGEQAKGWLNNKIPTYFLKQSNLVFGYLKLLRTVKKINPDTIVTTMTHSNAITLCLKLFFPSTKFIIRESSLPSVLVTNYGWKGVVAKCIYKYLYPKADLVLSPSKQIVNEFEKVIKVKTDNHRVLLNPVNQDLINDVLDKQEYTKEKSQTIRFVCVGRLSHEKGYDLLIGSLKDFKMPPPYDWCLDIIGDGNEKSNLQNLIHKLGLDNKISLRGYISSPWSYMRQSDTLLLPSRWEGLPNVVLESLACGTPVITINTAGSVREIQSYCKKSNDIYIADNISEFVLKMKNTAPKDRDPPSLLPENYKIDTVTSEFESILDDLQSD